MPLSDWFPPSTFSAPVEYSVGVRVRATPEEVKRLIREWAEQEGWKLDRRRLPALVFRHGPWPAQVEVVLNPDGNKVIVSFIASGYNQGDAGDPPHLLTAAQSFADGLWLMMRQRP
jgi:hypothetical protein